MTNIEVKTRSILDSLSNSEKKVAHYFLNNIDSIFSTPIATLAKEADVSQVTWIRFCKAIGFDGLKDLKKTLFTQLNANNNQNTQDSMPDFSDITAYHTVEDMKNAIEATSIQAIRDTMSLLDSQTIQCVVDQLEKARQIKLFGVGASALVANDFYNKLLRIHMNVIFSYDTHTQLTYGATTSSDDLCIIFSYSGATREMLEVLELAKKSGCPTVAITRYSKSPLAGMADYNLFLSAPEIDHRSGAMSSRMAQLALVDLLFTSLASKNYKDYEKYLELSSTVREQHRTN